MKKAEFYSDGKPRRFCLYFAVIILLLTGGGIGAAGQSKAPVLRATYNSVPSNYTQVGNTALYYYQSMSSIDVLGKFGSQYYSSTFSNNGYRVAMKVGSGWAVSVDCLNGTVTDGVRFSAHVEQQGELARICYVVTNTNDRDTVVSLGTHADVMIGNNDRAPISRRKDIAGNTYGLTLQDGNGAQLCVLFGAGLMGVSSVDDFWFGYYSQNYNEDEMTGNYYAGSNYMEENGSYDSGMGWCWKNRTVRAGETVTFAYLIGVGDVNLEPSSSFEVTPDDPDGWNDLSRPHRLTLTGSYESPAGIDGVIEYAVEDGAWTALTDTLSSGEEFTESLVAMFDQSKESHTIHFRIVDAVGNTSVLAPIIYKDMNYHEVTGITDKVYNWGEPLYQTELVCDIDAEQYAVGNYLDNTDAGIATFEVQGVFPYTIGRRTYSFEIMPLQIEGDIVLEGEEDYVYDGSAKTPEWMFSEAYNGILVEGQDYSAVYRNNVYPGTASVEVIGINNFCGTLSATFYIDKAPFSDGLFTLVMPDSDICYDGKIHAAYARTNSGVGNAIFTYTVHGEPENVVQPPVETGSYDVYLEFEEGEWYYGRGRQLAGSFSIYMFDAAEWQTLDTVCRDLAAMGWSNPWDMSAGITAVSTFSGLTIEKGHVTEFSLPDMNLAGEFPVNILRLPLLKKIDLSSNMMSGDIASAVSAFVAENTGAASGVEYIDISSNRLTGNIGQLAECFNSLNYLDVSLNCFEELSPMVPPSVELKMFGQFIEKVLVWDLDNYSAESLYGQLPPVLLYDHEAQTFINDVEMLCAVAGDDDTEAGAGVEWGMVLKISDGELSMTSTSAQNEYYGQSGDTLSVITSGGSMGLGAFRMKMLFSQGDANLYGGVDILDLQTAILYIFDEYNDRPFNFTASDVWTDGIINVQDVIGIVNVLAAQEQDAVSGSMDRCRESVAHADELAFVRGGELHISSSLPVAAFDITLSGGTLPDVIPSLDNMGMDYRIVRNGSTTRIIGYSLSGYTVGAGETAIASVGDCRVVSVKLSDAGANMIDLPAGGAVGMEDTGAVAEADIVSGSLVLNLPCGVDNLSWRIYSSDGVQVEAGVLAHAESGVTTIGLNHVSGNRLYILVVEGDGLQRQIKKVKL